jgi:hypothetical protein
VHAVPSRIISNLQNSQSKHRNKSKIKSYTSTEAEHIVRNKTGPLVILQLVAETVTENETANRVAISIGSVRVKLSSPEKMKFNDRK